MWISREKVATTRLRAGWQQMYRDVWQQGRLVDFIHTQWGILGAWGESTLERHQDFEPNIWPTELETIGSVMMVKVLLTLCLSKNDEFFSFYWENLILGIISQVNSLFFTRTDVTRIQVIWCQTFLALCTTEQLEGEQWTFKSLHTRLMNRKKQLQIKIIWPFLKTVYNFYSCHWWQKQK